MLLKLTYNRKDDEFRTYSFISDPYAIHDLWWQLTHNYKPQDGTEIGKIVISDLEGTIIPTNDRGAYSRNDLICYSTKLFNGEK
jgi:hypothetical protein